MAYIDPNKITNVNPIFSENYKYLEIVNKTPFSIKVKYKKYKIKENTISLKEYGERVELTQQTIVVLPVAKINALIDYVIDLRFTGLKDIYAKLSDIEKLRMIYSQTNLRIIL